MIARQIAAVLRLELRKTFLSRRGWWIYLLAAAPVLLTMVHWLVQARFPRSQHDIGQDITGYAALFQFYYLRGAIFFGCVGIFCNLFRGEMMEKTLHYYYMTPLRREILVAGKFLAGVIVAVTVFTTSAGLSFLMIGRHAGARYSDFIWHSVGGSQLEWYMITAALACIGYGAVFLMCGLIFRNPMIPAAVVFVWENLNPFLPSVMKKASVFFYLKSLLPVEVPAPGPFAAIVIDADPTPAWIAIPGLLALSLLILVYTGMTARETEISYGE